MFRIKLAEIIIEIRNHYTGLREKCKDYILDDTTEADFTVEASEEDLIKESVLSPNLPMEEIEAVCVYRQIGYMIMTCRAVVMHSLLLDFQGTGMAILAPSGIGKTTLGWSMRESFERVRIINGDKPILRFIDGRLMAFGTPWNGKEDIGCNDSVELKKLCFISQGCENRMRKYKLDDPMEFAEVAKKLFRQMLIPVDEEQADVFFSFVDQMLDVTECYDLHCTESAETAFFTAKEMGLC